MNIERVHAVLDARIVLFSVSNFNDFDHDLQIKEIYIDYNLKILHCIASLEIKTENRKGRINLGNF